MTTINPPAFYSVSNVFDPDAVEGTDLRRADYRFWKRKAVGLDPDRDCDALASALSRVTGKPRRYNYNALNALITLSELPHLQSLQEELFHLDLHRLQAIDRALAPADRDYFDEVDRQLTEFLTPTKPNQHLPGHKSIVAKINAILSTLDDTIAVEDDETDQPVESYSLQFHDDGTAELSARITPAAAVAIDARVRALAEAAKSTLAEALVQLLLGEEGVRVTLNLYRAMDIPDASAHLPGAGWLDLATSEEWAARASQIRDIDEVANLTTDSYRTPDAMRAFVVGRDGVCRGPGCGKSASTCEMDHRINHADGGPTTPANLAALCRRDHNLKTSGLVFYLMEPHTGNIIWLHDDGSWVCTEPEGPLSRKSRLWLQTLHNRREERNNRARQEAQFRKRARERDNGIPEEDTPPPF